MCSKANRLHVSIHTCPLYLGFPSHVCHHKALSGVPCAKPGAPGGSDGKESACNAGDPGLIPVSGRPRKILCWEFPLEKAMATHSGILAWRIPWTWAAAHGVAKSRTRLNDLLSLSFRVPCARVSLAIYFTHGQSQFPNPPHICSLHRCLHFCFANKFIYTIFLDSTYTHQYMIFVFYFIHYCFTSIIFILSLGLCCYFFPLNLFFFLILFIYF